MKVFISGVEKTKYLKPKQTSFTSNVNARANATFVLIANKDHEPLEGQEVIITDTAGNKLYAGLISGVRAFDLVDDLVRYTITAGDYTRYAERRHIANTFTNVNQSDIVRSLLTSKLATFGVTEGEIQDGATIERISYNYMRVSAALDELAGMNGRIWWIDVDKKLYFVAKDTYAAPYDIDVDHKVYVDLEKEHNDGGYRNTQIIRAGKGTTDAQTEYFVGDGTRKTFNVAFPIQSIQAIYVNDVEKTFGVSKQENEKDFYYNIDKTEVSQDDDALALTSFYTLKVVYYGYYPIVVSISDDEEIASRGATEGVSGIYESVDDDATIDSLLQALAKADGLMKENGKVQNTLNYRTYTNGLVAGMIQRVCLPDLNIDGEYLITTVKTQEYSDDGDILSHDVTCIDGYDVGGWTSFFKKLTGYNSNYTIRGSEMFVILNRQTDDVTVDDGLTVEVESNLHYVGTGIVGISDVYTESEYEEIFP